MHAGRDILKRLLPIRPWMTQINGRILKADALAGLTGAAIVLPQGVAFAVIAGLPPQYGLFTAMIVPIIAALWGSSMVMVSGPTTAISAVVFAALAPLAMPGSADYITLALTLAVLVGIIQLAAGLCGLGELIAFISHSVIVGFTAAAAVLIFVSQLAPALGLEPTQGGVTHRLIGLVGEIGTTNPLAAFLALISVGTILIVNRINRRLPAYIIALLLGAVIGFLLDARGQGIAHFAPLGQVVPALSLPNLRPDTISTLLPGAAAVAFVGLLEAISIGKSFAVRRQERFDSNQEIVGQGMSNMLGGLLQCYAGSGSFTRSGLNAESGARTPLSAIFAAVFLLAMLLVVAPLVRFVPVPAMAGIILFVAWKLINTTEIHHIVSSSRSETLILLVTFMTGIVSELDFAILAGVLTALGVFLNKSAHPQVAVGAPVEVDGRRFFMNAHEYDLPQCPQISMTRLEGPLFFGSIEHVEREFRRFDALDGPKIRIFILRGVGKIDLAGADFILQEYRQARQQGQDLHLIARSPEVLRVLDRLHCTEVLGQDHIHASKADAIQALVPELRNEICATCQLRIFKECRSRPAPPQTGFN